MLYRNYLISFKPVNKRNSIMADGDYVIAIKGTELTGDDISLLKQFLLETLNADEELLNQLVPNDYFIKIMITNIYALDIFEK